MKRAADLKPFDAVDMPGERRIVDHIEFTDQPVDSNGTTGVRVFWTNRAGTNVLAADKELAVIERADRGWDG